MDRVTSETQDWPYKAFFEQQTEGAFERPSPADDEKLEPARWGLSDWSPGEKNVVLSCVRSSGGGNLKEIGSRLPNKSKPEVQAFLNACAAETARLTTQRKEADLLGVPAAVEVDLNCSEVLDNEADALAEWQLQQDAELEERFYGDYWLLDWDCSRSVNSASYIASPERHKAFHRAHELLNLPSLLKLSSSLFMSSANPEADWELYSVNGPSLFCSAFVDLHQLVIAVTKRLVASTLFVAESRLRATAGYTRRTEQVRKQDVLAAVDILGLSNQRDYWTKAPRRCGWRILAKEPDGWTDDVCLDYAAVEAFLDSTSDLPYTAPTLDSSRHEEQPTGTQIRSDESFADDDSASHDSETVELDARDVQKSLRETQKICTKLKIDVSDQIHKRRLASTSPPRKRRKYRSTPPTHSKN